MRQAICLLSRARSPAITSMEALYHPGPLPCGRARCASDESDLWDRWMDALPASGRVWRLAARQPAPSSPQAAERVVSPMSGYRHIATLAATPRPSSSLSAWMAERVRPSRAHPNVTQHRRHPVEPRPQRPAPDVRLFAPAGPRPWAEAPGTEDPPGRSGISGAVERTRHAMLAVCQPRTGKNPAQRPRPAAAVSLRRAQQREEEFGMSQARMIVSWRSLHS